MNPYVTIYGPYPLTWGEYLGAVLKARLDAIKQFMKGVYTL